MVKPLCSNFRIITAILGGVQGKEETTITTRHERIRPKIVHGYPTLIQHQNNQCSHATPLLWLIVHNVDLPWR